MKNTVSTINAVDNIEKSKPTSTVNPSVGMNCECAFVNGSPSDCGAYSYVNSFGNWAAFTNRGKLKEEDFDCIMGDVSKFMADDEEKEKLKRLEGMNKWYYRDPQGQVQG